MPLLVEVVHLEGHVVMALCRLHERARSGADEQVPVDELVVDGNDLGYARARDEGDSPDLASAQQGEALGAVECRQVAR